jgi:hypothetical protein
MKNFFLISFLLFPLINQDALAANHYIDKDVAGGSGNGSSWQNAWNSIQKINWSIIGPGDTIFLSGGTSSKTYFETLVVGASGSAGSPITIKPGEDPDHNGIVILDQQDTRIHGVIINGKNHITVKNLTIRNIADAGFRVRDATAGIIIENNDVYAGNVNGKANARGYDVRATRGKNAVIVRNNKYSTPTSSTAQNDGIWSSDNDGVLFQGNSLIISNSFTGPDEGHNDCVQSLLDIYVSIIGNYCEQRNTKTGHSQGIFSENVIGTILIQNNVVYAPNTSSALITTINRSGYSGKIVAQNNTAYGSRNGTGLMENSPNSIFKNNIFITPHSNGQAFKIDGQEPPKENIDYNLLYSPNPSQLVYLSGAGTMTFNQWKSRGYEAHGLNADPEFFNLSARDLSLSAKSPAIDKGTTISTLLFDYSGNPRPRGTAYDIGAYESAGGETNPAPPTPPTPPPLPTPIVTNYSFSDITSSSVTLTNQGGITWATGKWRGSRNTQARVTGFARFAQGNTRSAQFKLPSGKVLKNIRLSSSKKGTYKVSDGVNPSKGGKLSANAPITVSTGWKTGSNQITIYFSEGWNGVIDDISF